MQQGIGESNRGDKSERDDKEMMKISNKTQYRRTGKYIERKTETEEGKEEEN